MRIEPVAYLEWAKLHEEGRLNLSRSGLPDRTLQELNFDPARLKITGANACGHPELLGGLSARYAANRPVLKKNFELVRDFVCGESKLSWVKPDSGIIAFPRIEAAVDVTRLAGMLEERYDTTVVPGRYFEEPRHFRLGFGGPFDDLVEGLENIRRALAEV